MAKVSLEPSGAHETPTGLLRYAIWHYRDADGIKAIPCAAMALIAKAADAPYATCAGPRPAVSFPDTANGRILRKLLQRDDLVDDADRLTERGCAVKALFLFRELVRAGIETPHGHRRLPF